MNLNLAGQRIIGSRIDFAVTLRTDGGYGFRIETDFVVHAISGDHRVSVEKTGQLTLDFTSGIQVRVEPDENYEAWTFDGPRGEKIVCAPGGELVTWSA